MKARLPMTRKAVNAAAREGVKQAREEMKRLVKEADERIILMFCLLLAEKFGFREERLNRFFYEAYDVYDKLADDYVLERTIDNCEWLTVYQLKKYIPESTLDEWHEYAVKKEREV